MASSFQAASTHVVLQSTERGESVCYASGHMLVKLSRPFLFAFKERTSLAAGTCLRSNEVELSQALFAKRNSLTAAR